MKKRKSNRGHCTYKNQYGEFAGGAQAKVRALNSTEAKARAAGFNASTVRHRMKVYKCSADEAIAMGRDRYYPPAKGGRMPVIAPFARAAGFAPEAILYRMKRFNCSEAEAVAMGPSGSLPSSRRGTHTDPSSVTAKAAKAKFAVGTIRKRMKVHECTADEAIAMGPPLSLTDRASPERAWVEVEAAKIGLSEPTVRTRIHRNWSVEQIVTIPRNTRRVPRQHDHATGRFI